jgi:hypothetical protein
LSAPSRASASNIGKIAKKFKNLQFFLKKKLKVLVQIEHNIACSTRPVNAYGRITVIDL